MESQTNFQTIGATIESGDNGNPSDLAVAREIGQLRRELEAMTRHFKKGYQHLLGRQGSQRRFEVIQDITQAPAYAPASAFKVREACTALGVSPSGLYAHRHKTQRLRHREDRVLADELRSAFDANRSTYGSPWLVRALLERGFHTSKTRVRRLMKSHGLYPRQKRRVRVRTTRSNPHLPIAPHLLLEAPLACGPGERFYSDITYIPTREGWLYAAATLDGYSRKCAGWSAADNMETPLVLRAAQRAFASADAKIHHSDQGSQYASELFRDFLQDNEIIQSMSRKGNCYDNAMMESFWATLKTECFDNFRDGIPATRDEAKQKLFSYIEVFYNRKRLHSALGYRSPIEFEEIYKQQNLPKKENLFFSASA
jgi:putative transposase